MAFSNLKKRLAVLLAAATAFTFAAPLGITTPVVAEAADDTITAVKAITVADNGINATINDISGGAVAAKAKNSGSVALRVSSDDTSIFTVTNAGVGAATKLDDTGAYPGAVVTGSSAVADNGGVKSGAAFYQIELVDNEEAVNYDGTKAEAIKVTVIGKKAGKANLKLELINKNEGAVWSQTIPVTVQGSNSLTSTISVNSGGTFTDTAATVPTGANIVLGSGSNAAITSAAIKITTTGSMSIKTLSAMVADNDTIEEVTIGYLGGGGNHYSASQAAKGGVDGYYCAGTNGAIEADFYADNSKPKGQKFTTYVYLETKSAGTNNLTVQINDTKWNVPIIVENKGHVVTVAFDNKGTNQTVKSSESGIITANNYNGIITGGVCSDIFGVRLTGNSTTGKGAANALVTTNEGIYVLDSKGIFLNSKDNLSTKITATSSRDAKVSFVVTNAQIFTNELNISDYTSIGNDGTLSVTKPVPSTIHGFVNVTGEKSADDGKTYEASKTLVIPVTITANSYTQAKVLDGEYTVANGIAEADGVNKISGATNVKTVYLSTTDIKTKKITVSTNIGTNEANYITYKSNDEKVFTVDKDGNITAVATAANEAPVNLTITVKNGPDTMNTLEFTVPIKVTALKIDNPISGFANPIYLSETTKTAKVGGETPYKNQLRYSLVKYNSSTGKYDAADDTTKMTVSVDDVSGELTLKDNKNQGVTIVEITGVTNAEAVVQYPQYAYVYYNMSEKTVDSITGADQVSVTVGKTVALDAASTAKSTLSYVSGDTSIATVGTDGVVTGVKAGTTYIKVTANETGITKNVTVVVKAATKKAVTFKNVKKTFKVATLKKAKKSYSVIKKSGNGKVTYKVTKGTKKYIAVSAKGVVTVKKGAVKGTYKVKVTVAAKGNFKKTTKTITIVVK